MLFSSSSSSTLVQITGAKNTISTGCNGYTTWSLRVHFQVVFPDFFASWLLPKWLDSRLKLRALRIKELHWKIHVDFCSLWFFWLCWTNYGKCSLHLDKSSLRFNQKDFTTDLYISQNEETTASMGFFWFHVGALFSLIILCFVAWADFKPLILNLCF